MTQNYVNIYICVCVCVCRTKQRDNEQPVEKKQARGQNWIELQLAERVYGNTCSQWSLSAKSSGLAKLSFQLKRLVSASRVHGRVDTHTYIYKVIARRVIEQTSFNSDSIFLFFFSFSSFFFPPPFRNNRQIHVPWKAISRLPRNFISACRFYEDYQSYPGTDVRTLREA